MILQLGFFPQKDRLWRVDFAVTHQLVVEGFPSSDEGFPLDYLT